MRKYNYLILIFYLLMPINSTLASDVHENCYIEKIFMRPPLSTSRFSVNEDTLSTYANAYTHKINSENDSLLKIILSYKISDNQEYPSHDIWNAIYIRDSNGKAVHKLFFDKPFTNVASISGEIDGKPFALSQAAYPAFRHWLNKNKADLKNNALSCP